MTVLVMATADLNDSNRFDTQVTQSADTARTGTYSYRIGGSYSLSLYHAGVSTVYARAAVYTEYNGQAIQFREGTTVHVNLELNPLNGTIVIKRYTTTLATVSGLALTGSSWFVVEVKTVIHDTLGAVILRVNGFEVYNQTSLDTRNGGTGILDNFRLFSSGLSYWDDILLDDADWPGLGGLHVLDISGDGTYQNWLGTLPALTTNPEVSGTKHTFTKDSLPANAINVSAAAVVSQARVTGQGFGALKLTLGAAESSVKGLGIAGAMNYDFFAGPFTPIAFDALEVGVASA